VRQSNIAMVGVVAALFVLCSNPAAQKVTSTSTSTFGFTNNKKYAWRQNHIVTRQGKKNNALIDWTIVKVVDRNLASKGFVEDGAGFTC
jgi:hypothetical protein